MGMHSIYIQQLVQPVAASLVMHMHGYTGGVATVGVLPYPAILGQIFISLYKFI